MKRLTIRKHGLAPARHVADLEAAFAERDAAIEALCAEHARTAKVLIPNWRFWIKSTCPKEFFWPPQPLDLGFERLNYNPWLSRSACGPRKFRVPLHPP